MKTSAVDRLGTASAEHDGLVRTLAQQRLRALQEEAVRSGGKLSPEALDELQPLSRLLDIGDRLRVAPARRRGPPAVAFLVTLAAVSVLLFARVPRTEIEVDTYVSSASFTLSHEQAVTNTLALRSVAAAGFDRVDAEGPAPQASSWPARRLVLSVVDGDRGCRGALTLDRIVLPAAARVQLDTGARDGRVHMFLEDGSGVVRVSVEGCVHTSAGGSGVWRGDAVRTLLLQLGHDPVDLELAPVSGSEMAFAPSLQIDGLSLSRVERVPRGDGILVRQVSTVLGGKLVLLSMNDAEWQLRVGAPLRFAQLDGELRAIEVTAGRLHLLMQGDVRGMTGGSEARPRSLMPTLLDWLKANHSLSLLWGTALYLLALLTSLKKWWKGSLS